MVQNIAKRHYQQNTQIIATFRNMISMQIGIFLYFLSKTISKQMLKKYFPFRIHFFENNCLM